VIGTATSRGSAVKKMNPRIYIGTSGWHYAHWRGVFYPESLPTTQWLGHYARHFGTVEINNSFYKLPSRETFAAWHKATPKRFTFAVKANRYITHMKKLKEPQEALDRFFDAVEPLADKQGPILFQLPPRWHKNTQRLAAFLDALPPTYRYAFEFRDPDWHSADVYDLLRAHNAAFCIYDLAGFRSPVELTTDFAYLRLHGPAGAYAGRYTKASLRTWAERIHSWGGLKQAYVYFDNDEAGYAVTNAIELKKLLG